MGYAATGRLVQFIGVEGEAFTKGNDGSNQPSPHVRNALLDGLRQLGVHVMQPEDAWDHVGFWLIKHNKRRSIDGRSHYIPVIVYIDGESQIVYGWAPGLSDFVTYRELLLAVGSDGVQSMEPEAGLKLLHQRFRQVMPKDRNVLLLCDKQNLSQTWKWLQDMRLQPDTLVIDDAAEPVEADWPGLRVVRVRGRGQQEVPEWYGHKEQQDDVAGFAKGLFQASERVYASTYGKPRQFSNLAKGTSAIDRPDKQKWNPGYYEMSVVAMQPGDSPVDIADRAHRTRDAVVQFDDPTALPLVLHLAKGVEEYVLQINDVEDEEDE